MDDREKLIELLQHDDCPLLMVFGNNMNGLADYLIANGVTFATDNHVDDKMTPTEPLTNCQQWIPVTERLPEIVKTERVFRNVYRKSGRVLCACLQADGKRMVKEGYMEFFNDYPKPNWKIPGTIHSVTHWMPLPEPPKGE